MSHYSSIIIITASLHNAHPKTEDDVTLTLQM